MEQSQGTYDDIQFLTGSPQRRALLAALCDESARPSELCATIDATRTTIQRILAGFRERQWVVKHDGDYRATVTGRWVHDRYESLRTEVERAQRLGPLAAHLGPIGDGLPATALERGRLTVSEDGNPLAALSRFTEWLQDVEGDIHAISPVVARPFNDISADLLSDGTEIDFVIDSGVLEQSRAQYEDELRFGADHDRLSVYVHETPLSMGIALDEHSCCVAGYDDNNNMRAILETTDGETYDWASDVFERHRERSAPLTSLYDMENGRDRTDGRER